MIYTINTTDHLLYPVTKECFHLSDEDIYNMINEEFSIMVDRLAKKGVKYNMLKRALIPNQNKKNNEVCFIFDSSLIASSAYGLEIFSKFLALLDTDSTYSILVGDYIDILKDIPDSQLHLLNSLNEVIIKCNPSIYQHSSQYYIIYVNSITNGQLSSIVNGLQNFNWFYGYSILNYNSKFKTYLSCILSHICVKCKNTFILSHPSDCDDAENVNMKDYPFEKNGFKLISIHEDSFGAFLSYKIESIVPDKDDISFSFNALFPKFDSTDKLKLNFPDGKWNYVNGNSTGKDGIIKSLAFDGISKDAFSKIIFKEICSNYIYNLNINDFGDLLFNVCIELPTRSGNIRKTTVALKYAPQYGEMAVITIT